MQRDLWPATSVTIGPGSVRDRIDPERLGWQLAQARRSGTVAPGLDLRAVDGPVSAAEVQDAAVIACGQPIRGHTLAATSDRVARQLGCDGPVVAPLLAGSLLPSRAGLTLPPGILGIGAQYVFVLGRPFPLDDEDPGDGERLAEAILSCHLGLQILGRRVPHGVPLNALTATADFGLDVAQVRGPSVVGWREIDLATAPVTLALDGHIVARGSGAEILGRHPLAAVTWLAETLSQTGRGLDAGDTVAVGSCTGLSQLVPGQRVEADFGAFGTVVLDTQ